MESELKLELSGSDQNEEIGVQAQGEPNNSDEENLREYQLAIIGPGGRSEYVLDIHTLN